MRLYSKSSRFRSARCAVEVTLEVHTQAEIRAIIAFLTSIAELPDQRWRAFGHEHLQDSRHSLGREVDVVVVRADARAQARSPGGASAAPKVGSGRLKRRKE